MEKLLFLGINTRHLVNSGLKLKYNILSGSYYSTLDFNNSCNETHILNQIPEKSCGLFEENYSAEKLLEKSKEKIEDCDYIILSTGISPSDFKNDFKKYKKKIIGNKDIAKVEDKYTFYKEIKNSYLTPKTLKLNYDNINEVIEITNQYKDKQFIIKPVNGSGGYGISYLNFKGNENKAIDLKEYYKSFEESDFIIQEYISGLNISSSVLGNKKEVKNIINSRMLIESDFGIKNSFKYSGNILPLDKNTLNLKNSKKYTKIANFKEISKISENIVEDFQLIGSNGVDMILNENGIYIIEINPRFQGTYESVEKILNINLLEAHIKACKGELINIPQSNGYSMKKIIYSKERVKINDIPLKNIYDIPYKNVIIEKDQPIATVMSYGKNLKNCIKDFKIAIENVNNNISNT